MTVRVLGRRLPAAATYVGLLATGVLLLLVTVAAAFWQEGEQRARHDSVRASFEARAHLRQTLIVMQESETGQRGFLLTGDPAYEASIPEARAAVARALTALEQQARLTPAASAAAPELRDLANRKFNELQLTLDLVRGGRRGEALAIMQSDFGREVMERARLLIDTALDEEGESLSAQLRAAEESSLALRLIVLLAAVLLVVIAGILIAASRSAMAELRASHDAVQAANDQLSAEMLSRRQAESRMVQMQKMEAIGQLTGGVAHDFNNMLAVIIGALNLMQKRLARGDTEIGQFVEAAQDAARRAATLTSRLLAFARRTPLAPAVIDVNRLVSGMSELLRRTLGEAIAMETVLAGGLWRVHADTSQLENAVVNICVNARDAMPEGGKLTIETSNAYLDENYAAKYGDVAAGQYVLIAISDTGAGMAPDVVAKAFEPFFTTKEVGKGTGLGLSHVHGFLKQSNGHIAIYSEVGHGTSVKLYLPRSHDQETAAPPRIERTAPPPGDPGTWVLVVEDDERVRALSAASLRELGYSVLHAANGAEALAALDAHPDIALLFTDIVMPDMSGRKLADEAKRRRPEIKVLYTTGYTQNAIVHNGVVDADARLLLKPYSLDDLALKVRAVLDEK